MNGKSSTKHYWLKKNKLKIQIIIIQKKVCKDFQIKNSDEYHDLDLKSDTLLVADAFENFKKLFLEIHKLNSAKFLSAPGLARETALLLTDICY